MHSLRSRLGLPLAAMLCFAGCATAPVVSSCPPFPEPGLAVVGELERLTEAEYPATWDWLDRLYRLRDQLAACG